jgi:hypothetical protein
MPGDVHVGDLTTRVAAFLTRGGFWVGIGISAVLAVGSIFLVVLVVINWRADHFKHWPPGTAPPAEPEHPLATAAKNVAGVVLVLLGLVMALPGIPGQGILTMIVGITLIDFPGKRGLERRLIGRPRILHAINKLRARFHRAPLDMT